MKNTLIRNCRGARAAWLLAVNLILAAGLAGAAVQDLAGRYVGAWTNTTFGSTGRAEIIIQVAGTNATITFNMDGFVFGYVDPPVITMPGTVNGDQIVINNQGVGVFGDITGLINATNHTFSATLTNIPGGAFQNITAVGTIANGLIFLNYTVNFNQPPSTTNPAYGVMGTSLVPPILVGRSYRDGTNVVVQWTGGLGPYQIVTRTNLVSGVWTNTGAATTNLTATVPIGPGRAGFIRVGGQ